MLDGQAALRPTGQAAPEGVAGTAKAMSKLGEAAEACLPELHRCHM